MQDIIVIGGGVTGLASALALAEAGLRVALVDPVPAPGDGASGVPSALLTPPVGRLAEKPLGQLAYASWARYPAWVAGLEAATGIAVGVHRCGSLRLSTERPRRPLRPGLAWLDRDALMRIEPAVMGAAAEVGGAVRSGAAAALSPRNLLAAVEVAYQRAGGVVVRSRAVALLTAGDRVTGVRLSDGGTHAAESVVLAAGLGAPALLAPLGVALPVVADAGQMVQLTGVPCPAHILLVGDYALVGRTDGTVWVGGVHLPADGDAYDTRRATGELVAVAADVLGARGRVLRAWEGLRPRAANGVPCIGPVPGWRGLLVAAGHGSNGFLLAPLTGAAIRDWASAGRPRDTVAALCDPARRMGVPVAV